MEIFKHFLSKFHGLRIKIMIKHSRQMTGFHKMPYLFHSKNINVLVFFYFWHIKKCCGICSNLRICNQLLFYFIGDHKCQTRKSLVSYMCFIMIKQGAVFPNPFTGIPLITEQRTICTQHTPDFLPVCLCNHFIGNDNHLIILFRTQNYMSACNNVMFP